MITADQLIYWLNWEQPSHLSRASLAMLREITAPGTKEERKQFLLDEVENCSRETADPLERAEVLVYCSKEWLQRSCLEKARNLAQDAKFIYESKKEKEQHRQAVAAWIMHFILLKQFEYVSAFSNARMARVNFQKQAEIYKSQVNDDRMNWYHERINEMTADLAAYPEEAYEWLTKFSGSHLSGAAQDIKNSITANIQKKNYSLAYQQMDTLCQVTQKVIDIRETSEAFAFCGLAAKQMGNIHQSVYLLKKAQSTGTQTSHEYACIRWMLGLIQMRMQGEYSKGIANLETSILKFEALQDNVDHQNKTDTREWYAIQIVAMRKVLKNLVESTMRPGANLVS
jgi:hypothetical protein